MNRQTPIAVIDAVRTPMAKAFTTFSDQSAVQLGTHAVGALLKRAMRKADGFDYRQVDEVIMGNVAGPPDAANIARVIALSAGIPKDRIAHTVNRNCASGMESIIGAWQTIESQRSEFVVAGGTESMSQIPMLVSPKAAKLWMRLAKCRTWKQRIATIAKFRPSHFKPIIGVQLGLTDPVSRMNMGETAELLARQFEITRQQQDQFALRSHQKAAAARKECFFSGEIASLMIGEKTISKDNGPRDEQSLEQLAKLRPFFDRSGTVTAGNSCPLTDGAAAMLLTSIETSLRFDRPLGYISAYAVAGCDPHRMGLGPVYATAKLLDQTGLRLDDFDLVELNEAFAAQVIACQRAFASKRFASEELGRSMAIGELDDDRLNVHGGAIALGHPVGMTGTRLVLTLLRSLRKRGLRKGLATLCVGGGQGVAMMVETELEG
ncbi:thiolase family protein [Roseiconus lacunae]|uniref:thiolase family protein n=1 Tax=Roseiconus lacunae TaxID=2605694 RepID=UPI001E455332|nr:thiolase family protein [Roseiconus lacunae]MCD0459921.1 thiolase family protein [Roseiconus lacunae]